MAAVIIAGPPDSNPPPGPPGGPEGADDRSFSQDSRLYVDGVVQSVAGTSPKFQQAWEKLEVRYKRRLLRFVEKQMGPVARRRFEPEDVMNEAWARAYKDRLRFVYSGPLSFYRWLQTQARRVILDVVRKEKSREELRQSTDLSGSDAFSEPPNESAGPVSRAAQGEMRRVLEDTLATLPDLYRGLLDDFYLREMSREDLAKKYGRLPNTITHQLKRGLEHWKKAIAGRLGPGSFDDWFGRA